MQGLFSEKCSIGWIPAVGTAGERGGKARTVRTNTVDRKHPREFTGSHAGRKSKLRPDESTPYPTIGTEYARHRSSRPSVAQYCNPNHEIQRIAN